MAGEKAIVGGRRMDFTYGDCQKEMDMVNRAFLETMLEGDANGLGFQYPIPAYGIGADYDWSDTEQNRLLFSLASHYGTPYFINYMGNGMKPEDVRTSYDGIRPDFHVLRKKAGGFSDTESILVLSAWSRSICPGLHTSQRTRKSFMPGWTR